MDPKEQADADTIPESATPDLEAPAAGSVAAAAPLSRRANVGRYIVLHRIGGGGMGVVYAAYDPDLDRRLAVKVLRPDRSAASEHERARLMREAQAMARLQHPNVAAIYDVGAVGEQVFIAMELVEGTTLTRWMQTSGAPRPWRDVLDVFAQAGRGLAAAHAAGIVHRDFKPDNVLIGRDGRVRVLDFGLARASRAEATPEPPSQELEEAPTAVAGTLGTLATPLTKTGSVLGTPLYMSPEQWRNEPADARSDQFSFCVALYEALYGRRPFPETTPELGSRVQKGEVEPPPEKSGVPLRLAEVVLRGLRPRPEDRHPSMEGLLEALGRDPGLARRRWTRRGAVLLGVGALVLGMGAFRRHQARVCQDSERKLGGIWDAARKQAVEKAFLATRLPYAADAYRGVAQALDRYTASWAALHTESCQATRVRGEQSEELLGRRMQCLGGHLEEIKELVDVLAAADAKVVERAVPAARGLSSLRDCGDPAGGRAAIRLPADPAARARVEELRGRLRRARALERAGRYRDGLAVAMPLLPEAQAVRFRPLEAEAQLVLGQLEVRTGDLRSALRALEEAALAAEAAGQPELAARAASALVVAEREQGRYEPAHAWGRRAQAALEAAGADDELASGVLLSLGTLYMAEGRYDEAVAPLTQALVLTERAFGPDHPDVATAANNLGTLRKKQGRLDEAEAHYRRALALREKALGPRHPEIAASLNNLGGLDLAQGRYEAALGQYRRAQEIWEEALGKEHPQVAFGLNNVATALQALGRYDEALVAFRRALVLREKTLGPEHPYVAISRTNLGGLYYAQGRYAEALAEYRRAVVLGEKTLGLAHPDLAPALDNLSLVLRSQGSYDEALVESRRALAIREKALGPTHPDVASSLHNLGVIFHAKGSLEEALAHYQRALGIREKALGPSHPAVASTLSNLGVLAKDEGHYTEAMAYLRRAIAIEESALGKKHPALIAPLTGLGETELARHHPERALAPLERALELEQAQPHSAADTAETRFALAQALWDSGSDRARARLMASEARESWQTAGKRGGKELREIDRWLARRSQ